MSSRLIYIPRRAAPVPDGLLTDPLPPLPKLLVIHFFFYLSQDTIYLLLHILSQHILDPNASPALCDVVLTYGLVHRENQLPIPDPLSLVALDEALAAHPGAPSILWRFNFKLDDGERHCTELKDVLTAWMPMMQESTRLLFEDYTDLTDGY
jgi:hypothetical protein